jgi:hypothetical protein
LESLTPAAISNGGASRWAAISASIRANRSVGVMMAAIVSISQPIFKLSN